MVMDIPEGLVEYAESPLFDQSTVPASLQNRAFSSEVESGSREKNA